MITNLVTRFAAGCTNEPSFFGLKPWYHYLKLNGDCSIQSFQAFPSSGQSDFLLIALAVVDDLLVISGLVAIGFIIYAGVLYVTSQGSPDQTAKAQSTIQNSLIGLLIAVLAIAAVRFIGAKLG